MSISDNKITAFTNVNVGQADRPNLTALQVQQLLDSSPEELRVALNGLIDDLIATTDSASGADNIGITTISGVTGNTVQTVAESLKTYVDTLDGANVKNTGNETIAGVKTFSSSPLVPAPTTDLQASTKKYVDDVAASFTLGAVPDNTLTEAKMANEMKKDISGGVASYSSYTSNVNVILNDNRTISMRGMV